MIDRATDVISFALEDSEQYYVEGMARNIGDIFISVDRSSIYEKYNGKLINDKF